MMDQRDVLFLCQFFYPEYNSSATLPWDTAEYLAKSGLKVGAMCGYPREYNMSGKVPTKEVKNGVFIKRLRYIQLKREKKLARLVNYFSFTLSVLLHIRELKKYKIVIVYSNPPILPMATILAKAIYHTKIVFVSFDVYPEIAYASGNLAANGMIAKIMRYLNRKLFAKVSTVVALTDEMKDFLLTNRSTLSKDRVTVIPNWAHEARCLKDQATYSKFGYSKDDFIVSYFGNMGICQDMETIIQAIELLKENNHIKFFIIGHGSKKEYVIEKTKELNNVQVLDFLTGREFEQAVSISSCSIVSLERGLRGMCAPSKYYSYLQDGIPVISVVEKDSYLAKEIIYEEIGKSVENGEGRRLAEEIKKIAEDKDLSQKMAVKAQRLYIEKYEKNKCLDKYVMLLKDLMEIDSGK